MQHWSKLWDMRADAMDEGMRLYSVILRRNMRRSRGFEVTFEGRSCVVAFQGMRGVGWAASAPS